MPACPALKDECEAIGVAVADRETVDGEFAGIEDPAFRQRNELKRDRRPVLAPETREHPDDDIERPRTAVDRHDVGALPQPQRRKQTGNAEQMVEMTMRQQEPVQPAKAGPAPKQL